MEVLGDSIHSNDKSAKVSNWLLGMTRPQQPVGKEGLALYKKLNSISGVEYARWSSDVAMAIVDFIRW
jgi:hypothetical protein